MRLTSGLRVTLKDAGEYVTGEIDATKHVAVIGKTLFGFAEIRSDEDTKYLYPRVNIRRTA
jgi:hypothetical protein